MTDAPPGRTPDDTPHEIPYITHQWVDEGCEAAYRQCVEQIEEIQKAAREAAEPWVKRATHWHSIGTRPILITTAKP